jgi:uracil-DNA glycosylase
LETIKVVILGQDPYYADKNQANGIAFSVNGGVRIPPSLRNIFKEAYKDRNYFPKSGDLSHWVDQGVFMFNTSLTVRHKFPNSHMCVWKKFTECIINIINLHCENVIFVSWGENAKKHYDNISSKHMVLFSSHPSPLSCYKTNSPFIGSDVFNKINQILLNYDKFPIVW